MTMGLTRNLNEAREFAYHLHKRTKCSSPLDDKFHLIKTINHDEMSGKLVCQSKQKGELPCVEIVEKAVTCKKCLSLEFNYFRKENHDLQKRKICR